MKPLICAGAFLLLASMLTNQTTAKDAIDDAINDVLAIEKDGKGNAAASRAMQTLARNATKADIPRLLRGMDKANKISANWLRGAIVAVSQNPEELPTNAIKDFFVDDSHSQLARLMAFELLSENDNSFADETIPTLVDDASLPLRRMAIEWHIDQAKKLESGQEKLGLLGFALHKARDLDQVTQIASLMRENGVSIDLQKQLGFLNSWKIVGTFDNKDESGFDVVYGPEKNLTGISILEDAYEDNVDDEKAKWFSHSTTDSMGVVDLTKAIGPIKGVAAYAYTTFDAVEAREVDIRIGCINAHKVWLNGKLIISNEVYHNGNSADKFSGVGNLVEGKNEIVIKVCQNEQTQEWAQRWEFQIRVCDETGFAIQPAEVAPSQ